MRIATGSPVMKVYLNVVALLLIIFIDRRVKEKVAAEEDLQVMSIGKEGEISL